MKKTVNYNGEKIKIDFYWGGVFAEVNGKVYETQVKINDPVFEGVHYKTEKALAEAIIKKYGL